MKAIWKNYASTRLLFINLFICLLGKLHEKDIDKLHERENLIVNRHYHCKLAVENALPTFEVIGLKTLGRPYFFMGISRVAAGSIENELYLLRDTFFSREEANKKSASFNSSSYCLDLVE